MKYLLVILFSLYVLGGRAENRASFPGDKVVTIDEFIRKDTPKDVGFFNVYIQDGRYYLEVPDDMLRRDILVAVTIIKGTAQKERSRDARFGYGGDSVFDRMIRFIKNRDRIEIVSPQVFHLGVCRLLSKSGFSGDSLFRGKGSFRGFIPGGYHGLVFK